MLILIFKQMFATLDTHYSHDELLEEYGLEVIDALDVLRSYCGYDEAA